MKMFNKINICLIICTLFGQMAFADTSTFQYGVSSYTGSHDLNIRDNSPDANQNGLKLRLKCDAAGFNRVSLLSFDISSIPTDATVTSVSLQLITSAVPDFNGTLRLFKLLRTSWSEGFGTWNKYDGTNAWTTAGAKDGTTDIDGDWTDGSPGSLSSMSVTTADTTGTVKTFSSSAALVSMIQSALGGTAHLVIHENNCDASSIQFYDNEDATASNHPLLTVVYTPAGGGGGGGTDVGGLMTDE